MPRLFRERTRRKKSTCITRKTGFILFCASIKQALFVFRNGTSERGPVLLCFVGFMISIDEFIRRFRELRMTTPKVALRQRENENCDFTHLIAFSKNLYYCFDGGYSQDCYYSQHIIRSRDCVDSSYVVDCELSYECLDCTQCYNSTYLWDCTRARDSSFCYDCVDCSLCFGCSGLRKKQYYLWNKPVQPEVYEEEVLKLRKSPPALLFKKLLAIKESLPHQAVHQLNCENCTGDFLISNHNLYNCFDVFESQDCGYLTSAFGCRDTWDCLLFRGELCYECVEGGDNYNVDCSMNITACRDSAFLNQCFSSRNCFGCCYLQKREFYFLNEPLSPDIWRRTVSEITAALKKENLYNLSVFL